ncbi:F-box protein At4g22280-like [Vicia villosa]|uniref:F-box protein At4g22280-like n=1 Tax=Vicia villosa TaxID=3911 RepID=UPI00273C0325|nr:F-box protein At4g22280-like [Vicia villosa]
MIPRQKKTKLTDIQPKDRLGNLPDCLIHHILSFLNCEQAVQTCILSVRWKHLWKHLHALIFHKSDVQASSIFTEFVSNVLSHRDSSISLHALDFTHETGHLEPQILDRIMNYAISQNVHRLGLSVISEDARILSIYDNVIAQISLNFASLTYLKLSLYSGEENLFPKSLNLPALTTLELGHFTFSVVDDHHEAEPFSMLNRLNSLLISDCTVQHNRSRTKFLCISIATLVNFTMYNNSEDFYEIDLITPSLRTFSFRGTPYQKIFGRHVFSLKHVNIDAEVIPYNNLPPLILLSWFIMFCGAKSLTVTATTLQVLSLIPDNFMDLNKHSLVKLKLLKVEVDEIQYGLRMELCKAKLKNIASKKEAARIKKAFKLGMEPSPAVPEKIVDFLLQNSPSAEVDLVDCRKRPLRPRHL